MSRKAFEIAGRYAGQFASKVQQGAFLNYLNFNINDSYVVSTQKIIESGISFPTTAVGRETSEGAGDAPTIPLTYRGLAHPSIVYAESGFNGYKYWVAFTPFFNVIPSSSYENPHVLASNDGITWEEPSGISNPIDLPPASPGNGYWSDTNLKLGSDGYLHMWYRSNYIEIDGETPDRAIVHMKSSDGVNWTAATLCYSTDDVGLTGDNLIMSQSFLEENGKWTVYDVINADSGGINPTGDTTNNQTQRFVIRRTATNANSGFDAYSETQVVNFANRPWGTSKDPWHLEVIKYGNLYIMAVSVGDYTSNTSDELWIALSSDGKNFKVLEDSLVFTNNYKSTIVPTKGTVGYVELTLYAADKDGYIELQELKIINESASFVSTSESVELTTYKSAMSTAGYTLSQEESDALNVYVNNMVELGQWDNINDFMPLIGTTLAQQSIKLKYKNSQAAVAKEGISDSNVDSGKGLIFSPRVATYPPALDIVYTATESFADQGAGVIAYYKHSGPTVTYKALYGSFIAGHEEFTSNDVQMRTRFAGQLLYSTDIGNGEFIYASKVVAVDNRVIERKTFKNGTLFSYSDNPSLMTIQNGTRSHYIGAQDNGSRGIYGFEGQIRLMIVHNGKITNEKMDEISTLTTILINSLGKNFS